MGKTGVPTENLITFWESELKEHRYIMGISTAVLIEETIAQLKEFRSIKEKREKAEGAVEEAWRILEAKKPIISEVICNQVNSCDYMECFHRKPHRLDESCQNRHAYYKCPNKNSNCEVNDEIRTSPSNSKPGGN